MGRWLVLVVACAALALVGAEEDETQARLLVSKHILNRYLVQNMDLVVKYTLYNVGQKAALNVELNDHSFHPEIFQVRVRK
jgi:translocon-associated protein subunit beta